MVMDNLSRTHYHYSLSRPAMCVETTLAHKETGLGLQRNVIVVLQVAIIETELDG